MFLLTPVLQVLHQERRLRTGNLRDAVKNHQGVVRENPIKAYALVLATPNTAVRMSPNFQDCGWPKERSWSATGRCDRWLKGTKWR